jgi:hypothetical protein
MNKLLLVSLLALVSTIQTHEFHVLPAPPTSPGDVDEGSKAKLYISTDGSAPSDTLEADLVPNLTSLDINPSGSTVKIGRYGDNGWEIAAKTGMACDLSFKFVAPGNNAIMAGTILAGWASASDNARCQFVIKLPDGAYIAGHGVIEMCKPESPLRGVFEYSVKVVANGTVAYTAPV